MQRYLLLMMGLSLVGQPCAARNSNDWLQVTTIAPGQKIVVVVNQASRVDSLPPGKPKIKGVFFSASSTSVTLLRKNGKSITLARDAVSKVSVQLPVGRRTKGWIGTAIVLGAVQAFTSWMSHVDDPVPVSGHLQAHAIISAPAAFFFLRGFRMKEVYRAPATARLQG